HSRARRPWTRRWTWRAAWRGGGTSRPSRWTFHRSRRLSRREVDERNPRMTRHEPIVKEDRDMDTVAFEASLKNAVYEVGTSKGTPSKATPPHSHDFDVRALVLSGELTLT